MRCSAIPGCERFLVVKDRVNAVINGTLSGSPRSVSLLCINIRAVKLQHSGPASKRLLI